MKKRVILSDFNWISSRNYFVIHFDARDSRCKAEFGAIAITLWIRVRLNRVHVGRRQNAIIVKYMVEHEFADTASIWVVVIDTVPYANVAIATSCDHEPDKTKIKLAK